MSNASASRNELDTIVANIELTLVSIVQGVALSFLAENARSVLREGWWETWPYVGVGLLIILLFWSRSIIHTLTLIRWPLEFVHNFFYIACTMVEAIAFTRLHDPVSWFVWNAIFSALVWGLFAYDLRMVRSRRMASRGEEAARLYQIVMRDQLLNIFLLIPAILLFNIACAATIHRSPEFFLGRGGHLFLVAAQGVGLVCYLAYVIRAFVKLTPLIGATREEWRLEEMPGADAKGK